MPFEGGAARPVYIVSGPPYRGGAAEPVFLVGADGVTPLGIITSPLPVTAGGTNAQTAAGARSSLGVGNMLLVPLAYDNPVAAITWASMPAALTEFPTVPRTRTKVDLTLYTQARLSCVCIAAGVADSELRAQYSVDQSSWNYLDGSAGPAISLNNTVALVVSGWVNLVSGAKADVFIRLVGIGGNGSTSPTMNAVGIQFR